MGRQTEKKLTPLKYDKSINLHITFPMDMTIEKYLLFELVKVIVVHE